MIDFIEHTPKPREAVARAYDLLAPGGVICLVTPDIHSLTARLAGKRWWHLRPGHLAYFSKRSLAALLAGAGFTIVSTFFVLFAALASAFVVLLTWPFRWALKLVFRPKHAGAALFFKRISIKLALGDSFEIYARKEPRT